MLLFILLLLLSCHVLWLWRNRRFFNLYRKVGSRFPFVPFMGHGYLYLTNGEKVLNNLFKIGDHAISNGGMSTTWLLHRFYLMLADPVDAGYVLKHHLEKDELMLLIRYFTRTSSVFAKVAIWRPRRKIVSALLSHKNVSKFEPVFAKNSEVLVEQLRPLIGKEAFSIWEHLNAYTVDITGSTIFGIDVNSQTNLMEPLRLAINGIMELAAEVLLQIWYHVEFLLKRSSIYKQLLEYDHVVKCYVDKALKKHTDAASRRIKNDIEVPDDDHQISLLHLFAQLKEQRGIDHTTLYDESLGLLMAASDTTAVGASTAAAMLAHWPDVQEKAYQELYEVFGDTDRHMTIEDLPRLKYMEAVIKEALRLYPPAPHVTRKALEDIVLPSGLSVPKGTNFLISAYALNRNPKYWGPDADEFRPERFLDGSLPDQSLTIYFSFSYGPRGCPGIQFAMMSMKTSLGTLLRRYRLLPATVPNTSRGSAGPTAPLRFLFGVVVKEADNFPVRIEARHGK
ncbi:cytochrome P450 4d2-like isoform X1 [Amyelois transitella]|uniref:cytochrome P450 4d2-like isoform X1 n=1 Tax=Amyelois transitella TaxID=680683 RepID=UPI00298FCE03|nr:cytochrome P450 4d2-like isoform X1 [Amyelois transitella]